MARTILTKVFNELMEKERDEYLENTAYQRDPNRSTYPMDTMNVTIQQK